ncbi:MAG: hypothetical protein CBC16_07950 [Verrucomicrobia bacterium TMED56]|nr:MAG: hypothetical protein CBC16_07950 [Verrucomicrobia bacterium TMED56]
MQTTIKFGRYLIFPNSKKIRILLPIIYLILLQILTGFPKEDTLKNLNVSEIAIQFSRGIFDYPFWLQDLSHVPLFFIFAWLSNWLFPSKNSFNDIGFSKSAMVFSLFYATFNEFIQTFIPDRFPSLGDMVMNLVGVCTGFLTYSLVLKKTLTVKES